MHKVFVSFHHANDQKYKEGLVSWAEKNKVFIDGSVDMGEIPEDWDRPKDTRIYTRRAFEGYNRNHFTCRN